MEAPDHQGPASVALPIRGPAFLDHILPSTRYAMRGPLARMVV